MLEPKNIEKIRELLYEVAHKNKRYGSNNDIKKKALVLAELLPESSGNDLRLEEKLTSADEIKILVWNLAHVVGWYYKRLKNKLVDAIGEPSACSVDLELKDYVFVSDDIVPLSAERNLKNDEYETITKFSIKENGKYNFNFLSEPFFIEIIKQKDIEVDIIAIMGGGSRDGNHFDEWLTFKSIPHTYYEVCPYSAYTEGVNKSLRKRTSTYPLKKNRLNPNRTLILVDDCVASGRVLYNLCSALEKIGYDFENQEHYVYFRNDYLNMFEKHIEQYSKVMPAGFLFNYAKANKRLKEKTIK